VANADDCNDLDSSSYPGGTEVCDGQDNDCDGTADNGASATWYADADGDGYGDPGTVQSSCSAPIGYVSNNLDCDDGEAASNPASFEICDGIDNNCVGGIDEGSALDTTDWYIDADGDGYGVPGTVLAACSQPTGYAANDDDCNDDPSGGAAINPAQTENWYDGIDQDCNGGSDYDQDGDGHDSEDYGGDDCDDTDGTRFDGCPLYAFTSHTFNTCGVSGREGPSLSACLNEYSTSPWATDSSYFNMLTQGIQRWTVPVTGSYRIEATGAAGQSNNNSLSGGLGVTMRGDFNLQQGEVIQILVGQLGTSNTTHGNENGGGGGSFVVDSANDPLVIAGGGGGGPSTSHGGSCSRTNGHAVTGTAAQSVSCYTSASGGTGGNGGAVGGNGAGAGGGCEHGAAGGGLLGDGQDGGTHCALARGGGGFVNGGIGGTGNTCYGTAVGGFGGGGGGNLGSPGGGGGYSGGAASGCWSSYSDFGGGGGSYNGGNNQVNAVQQGTANGLVEITALF